MKISSTTALIHVDTGVYPVYMNRVRKENPNVSFPPNPTPEQVAEFGYAVVHPTDRPQGDVVTEGQPTLTEGKYLQTWDVREFTAHEREVRLHELKDQLYREVNSKRQDTLIEGFNFETEEGQVIAVKLGESDQLVLSQLQVRAERLIAQGTPDATLSFRTGDNKTLELSAVILRDLTITALDYVDAVYQASWAIKDAVEAADSLELLPVVPDRLVGGVVHG